MEQSGNSSHSAHQRKHGRGIFWEHAQILDLLSIWGEEEIQRQLSSNHRNLAVYEKIADQLAERGHSRTAQECRNKCKSLKQNYNAVCKQNGQSGNGRQTCPYFYEMDQIFHGTISSKQQKVLTSYPSEGTAAAREEAQEVPPALILTGEEPEVLLTLRSVPHDELPPVGTPAPQEPLDEDQESSDGETFVEGLTITQEERGGAIEGEGTASIPDAPPAPPSVPDNGRDRRRVDPPQTEPQGATEGRARRGEHIVNAIIHHGQNEWELYRKQTRIIANRNMRQMQQFIDSCRAETQTWHEQQQSLTAQIGRAMDICSQLVALQEEDLQMRREDLELRREELALRRTQTELAAEYQRAKLELLRRGNQQPKAGVSRLRRPLGLVNAPSQAPIAQPPPLAEETEEEEIVPGSQWTLPVDTEMIPEPARKKRVIKKKNLYSPS
ncbi:uncharacterized protein LOC121917750 isoform X2 [Sceloporus undulatus]|uniref:uncharacterized protein LOC121917750 isoform X2 n=1 Tax=Sceloporus undulatus TaxID=8520 RepID=UPI001C4ADB34|nr:uncharacterized protein LOC121917750 isoform X2 [Sceloporus undulatus]